MTSAVLIAIFIAFVFILLLLTLQVRKLWTMSRPESDLAPLVESLTLIQKAQEQVDHSVRDEISRNRLEQSSQSHALRSEVATTLKGVGESVSGAVESFTRSNEQKLELLRATPGGIRR
jgi:predicted PurR-regulated permease PerM